ncbi:MAG: transposase [Pirellulales bacterium]
MALGRRKGEVQQDLFITADQLPKSIGHVFYRKLNELLAEAGFDRWVEDLCGPYYSQCKGRPGIPPGVYFRMLIVGYFEGLQSCRGIAWRCADSLSLRSFLGVPLTEDTPDHSSMSHLRDRLSQDVHHSVFAWVLKLAREKQLLKGKTVGVDSSTLEANAAMKSIVRRDTGEDWEAYVTQLMKADGVIPPDHKPTAEEIRNFDRQREGKRVSNDDWVSETDPESRITRMKDGTTHLAYKAEHIVDLDSSLIMAAEVYQGNQADVSTLEDSVNAAQTNQAATGSEVVIQEVVADKGYHSGETLETIASETPYRTYIPEPRRKKKDRRRGPGSGAGGVEARTKRKAVLANRRRMRTDRGKKLQRVRSERVERTFAHVLETRGARRTWLRGIDKVRKRYSIAAAAHNLGVLMRTLFGIGTPRGLQQFRDGAAAVFGLLQNAYLRVWIAIWTIDARFQRQTRYKGPPPPIAWVSVASI